jgi:nucleoside-diphosphate kinase
MVQRTLVLVKPDGVGKRLIGTVLQRLEQSGLRLVALRMLKLSRAQAEDFYKEHVGRPFYEALVGFMTAGPIVAAVWEAEDAVARARALMGATDSLQADPGTLRREFGTDNRRNLVHGSDSPASAEREVAFFFKPEEIQNYHADDWQEAALKG